MKKYSKKHLNAALSLRKWVRDLTFDRKKTQVGTIWGFITSFLAVLLDIRHQETFSHTIPNEYAREDKNLEGYHVP